LGWHSYGYKILTHSQTKETEIVSGKKLSEFRTQKPGHQSLRTKACEKKGRHTSGQMVAAGNASLCGVQVRFPVFRRNREERVQAGIPHQVGTGCKRTWHNDSRQKVQNILG
jgi:hypothetical protein